MDLVVNQVLASDPLLLLYTLQQGPPTPLTSWKAGVEGVYLYRL